MAINDNDIGKLKSVFATKDDLNKLEKRLEKKFVTKKEFNDRLDGVENRFISIEKRFDNLTSVVLDLKDDQQKIYDEMHQFRDDIFTRLDASAARTELFIQEHIVLGHHVSRIEGWTRKIATETHVILPE